MRKCVLILARGGSKSIPRKNLVEVNGNPLVSYPIEAAIKSQVSDVWVSSEDEEIIKVSKSYGANIHLRDSSLSRDLTEDIECFTDFILSKNYYDYIVHLRATSPQISSEIINSAVKIFEENYEKIDSLRSVIKSEFSPFKMWFIQKSGKMTPSIPGNTSHSSPRQTLQQAYFQNACIDIVKSSTIINKKSMVGDVCLPYIMKDCYNLDIDTYTDLKEAKEKIER